MLTVTVLVLVGIGVRLFAFDGDSHTPGLALDVGSGQSVAFDHLEFNFIQFVAYPQRLLSRGASLARGGSR
jgi:hypothetical protein